MAADPEPPEREFAAAVLRRKCHALLEEAAALVEAPREDSVHDARVQSRRLRAALEAFEDLLPPRPARAITRERKAQLRQVILPALGGLQATLRKLRIRTKRAGSGPPARSGGKTK